MTGGVRASNGAISGMGFPRGAIDTSRSQRSEIRAGSFSLARHKRRYTSIVLIGLAALVALASSGCQEKRRGTGGGSVGGNYKKNPAPTAAPKKAPLKMTEMGAKKTLPVQEKPVLDPSREEAAPSGEYSKLSELWGLGELHDLGPAGPTTAVAGGAIFITRRDEALMAARKGADFQSISLPPAHFSKYGRGPSVSKSHAYWISESGKLLRVNLKSGQVETLFDRARPGTRTSVQTASGRDILAFVAQIGEDPMAFAWASGGSGDSEILQLSPDGSTATSVTLVAGQPHPRAIILEGRTSMSPVHARRIRVTKRRITLEADEVVWVGPPSHVLTEIHAIGQADDSCTAFLPTARDFHDFGLAQLEIGPDGGECAAPGWQVFPNGLDPAPAATGNLCGQAHVLFARPSEAHPRSPQELHIAPLEGNVPQDGEVIARSRAFNDVSLAPTTGGAVVVWTADKRTWGMFLSCPKK